MVFPIVSVKGFVLLDLHQNVKLPFEKSIGSFHLPWNKNCCMYMYIASLFTKLYAFLNSSKAYCGCKQKKSAKFKTSSFLEQHWFQLIQKLRYTLQLLARSTYIYRKPNIDIAPEEKKKICKWLLVSISLPTRFQSLVAGLVRLARNESHQFPQETVLCKDLSNNYGPKWVCSQIAS